MEPFFNCFVLGYPATNAGIFRVSNHGDHLTGQALKDKITEELQLNADLARKMAIFTLSHNIPQDGGDTDIFTPKHPLLDPENPKVLKTLEMIRSGSALPPAAVLNLLGDRVGWLSSAFVNVPINTLIPTTLESGAPWNKIDLLIVVPELTRTPSGLIVEGSSNSSEEHQASFGPPLYMPSSSLTNAPSFESASASTMRMNYVAPEPTRSTANRDRPKRDPKDEENIPSRRIRSKAKGTMLLAVAIVSVCTIFMVIVIVIVFLVVRNKPNTGSAAISSADTATAGGGVTTITVSSQISKPPMTTIITSQNGTIVTATLNSTITNITSTIVVSGSTTMTTLPGVSSSSISGAVTTTTTTTVTGSASTTTTTTSSSSSAPTSTQSCTQFKIDDFSLANINSLGGKVSDDSTTLAGLVWTNNRLAFTPKPDGSSYMFEGTDPTKDNGQCGSNMPADIRYILFTMYGDGDFIFSARSGPTCVFPFKVYETSAISLAGGVNGKTYAIDLQKLLPAAQFGSHFVASWAWEAMHPSSAGGAWGISNMYAVSDLAVCQVDAAVVVV